MLSPRTPSRPGGPPSSSWRGYPPSRRRGSPGLRLAVVAAALVGSFAFARFWQRPPAPTPITDPLPQAAYVRERRWTEAVRDAVSLAAGSTQPAQTPGGPPLASGFCVLCAELSPAPENSTLGNVTPPAATGGGTAAAVVVTRPAALDWAFLASLPRPVGLAVRVRGFAGNIGRGVEQEPLATLWRTLAEIFEQAGAAGLHPGEVQIDFDCSLAGLPDYAAGLDALRKDFPGQPFRPVARPGWLDAGEFPALAREAGGYVLLVHSLEHPTGRERRPVETLCDAQAANDAVIQAARLGVPFRVALPASGLRLTVDAEGRLLSASTEPAPALERGRLPVGNSERVLLPDAGDMAALVAEWSRHRPAGLEGILWDRLPVAGERRLDWPGTTFAAVRAGRAPVGRLQWEFPPPAEGSDRRELALRNVGEAEAPLPPLLTVSCPEVPIAVEAAGPYEVATPAPKEHRPPRDVRFRLRVPTTPGKSPAATPAPRRALAPGATLLFGSVRLPAAEREGDPNEGELGAEMEVAPGASSPEP